jgi:multidrug resistance efflux pump
METKANDVELRSDDVQDVLGKVPSAVLRWGSTTLFLVVLLLLVGAYVFKYPDVVSGNVVLTTQQPPASVLARSSGKLDRFLAVNNGVVRKGAVLAIVQNAAVSDDVFLLKKRLEQWQANGEHLNDVGQFIDLRPLQLGSIQTAYTAFLNALVSGQRFENLQYHPLKMRLQKHQVEALQSNLSELRQRLSLYNQQVATTMEMWRRDSSLHRKGLLSDEEYQSSKNKMLQTKQSQSSLRSEIRVAEMEINQGRGTLLDLNKDYTDTESSYRLQVRTAAESLQTEINEWMRNFVLVSPIDGCVNQMGVWSDNQNVEEGETVFTVVPRAHSNPIGKILVPAKGSGKIKPGQRANVRLNNFPYQEFGYLEGIVEHVSETPDKEGQYVVVVRFPKGMLTNYRILLPPSKQMQGTAEVVTEDIRLLERLIYPLKSFLKKNL